MFLHLGIAFPDGRLQSRGDPAIVIAGYVIFPLAFLPGRGGRRRALRGLFVVVVVRSARYWRAADPFERLQLTPVYMFALLTFALVTVAQSGRQRLGLVGRVRVDRADAVRVHRRASAQPRSRTWTRSCTSAWRSCGRRAPGSSQAGDAGAGASSSATCTTARSRGSSRCALTLRMAAQRAPRTTRSSPALLDQAQDELKTSLAELRELARGIHPAVLTERGLEAAVQTLVAARTGAGDGRGGDDGRLPAPVETAAYFVVSEGLANVAKYAQATQASVAVRREDDRVTIEVADDGVGGADTANGSGLRGLADRVAALDGTLTLESPAGRGTQLRAEIPVA